LLVFGSRNRRRTTSRKERNYAPRHAHSWLRHWCSPSFLYSSLLHVGATYVVAITMLKITRNLAIANRLRRCVILRGRNASPVSFRVLARLIPTYCHVKFGNYKRLSCRREAARRSVSSKISLSYSRSCDITPLSRPCVSSY